MVRFTRTLVVLAASIVSIAVEAMAQTPIAAPGQPATDLAGTTEPNPLPGLPRPPDQPASLLSAPAAEPVYDGQDFEGPYFEKDPLLDPADLPQPGWLFDVEAGLMGSHIAECLGQPPFPNGNAVPFAVAVPMAPLNWTVSPRFELGYRLPSGFGEVDFAYRFLLADGTGSLPTNPLSNPDAPRPHKPPPYELWRHRLRRRETSLTTMLGPGWTMKWRLGLRIADVNFDSRADEPPATPSRPAGSSSGAFPTTSSVSVRMSAWISAGDGTRGDWDGSAGSTRHCFGATRPKSLPRCLPRLAPARFTTCVVRSKSPCSVAFSVWTGVPPATPTWISSSATTRSTGGAWAGSAIRTCTTVIRPVKWG